MLKTFTLGGVHPDENKLSSQVKTGEQPIPETVYIPLSQHLGTPAEPVVNKGDEVKTGQLIAKATGFISANIHASVSGTVKNIEKVMDGSGYKKEVITITVKGDEWIEGIDKSPELKSDITATKEDIIKKVTDSGIVGLGGAAFPSHVKLSVPPGKKCDHVLINGAECEPFLTSDHRMMLEKTEELFVGINLVKRALEVETAIIGIENNKKDAIEVMQKVAAKHEGIRVQPLKVMYPQGGEKQLIEAILKREVPSGGLPIDAGVVVFNVGTVFAIYEAVQKNKPLFERYVTVTGKSIQEPLVTKTRIGTLCSELIKLAGGVPDDTGKIINGGPMMGKALPNAEVPVVKGCSGIVIMPVSEAKRQAEANCIRCSKCIERCPMGLEPYYLALLSKNEAWEEAEKNHVMDCIECGCCSYTCPAFVPQLDYIRLGKYNVGLIIKSRKQ